MSAPLQEKVVSVEASGKGTHKFLYEVIDNYVDNKIRLFLTEEEVESFRQQGKVVNKI